MSNLKTYFKKSVSVCKKSSAYIRAIPVLVKALYHAMVGNGNYEVSFTKIGRNGTVMFRAFPKNCLNIRSWLVVHPTILNITLVEKMRLWLLSELLKNGKISFIAELDYIR